MLERVIIVVYPRYRTLRKAGLVHHCAKLSHSVWVYMFRCVGEGQVARAGGGGGGGGGGVGSQGRSSLH